MRIALLSNVTVDFLADTLKKNDDVYLSAGFDTWQQDLINQSSELYSFGPEAVVILIHAGAVEWRDRTQIIDDWCLSFESFTKTMPSVPLFISSIDVVGTCKYGAEDRFEEFLENNLIEKVQKMHQKGNSIYLLPVKDVIEDIGRKSFYSQKMWYIGSMPYSIKGISALAELIERYVHVINGKHKKCLAVDLDNTLWGGVIGEDGVDGIVLSNHKEGARFYDTQVILKKMKEQGVMLAILSKNNKEDVEPVFSNPYMVLKRDDFVAEEINWNSKSDNIRKMARELNIGLDSFVFLDDNPLEREQMKAECPEVVVVDFPKDTALLPETVEKAYQDYFLTLELTREDSRKTEMYHAEKQRREELNSALSLSDYIKKLEIKMNIHFMKGEEEARVVQLINKTNQFNVTTKRYSEEDIRILKTKGDIVTVHISDKYGEQGLVAVIILIYENAVAFIDTFLLSCRVMGRNVEVEIASCLKDLLQIKGITEVEATYIKSAKNAPVGDLFDKLGFSLISSATTDSEIKRYKALSSDLPDHTDVFNEVVEDWS